MNKGDLHRVAISMYISRSDQRSYDRRLVKGNQRLRFEEGTPKGGRADETSDLSMTVFAGETLGRADKATSLPCILWHFHAPH